VCRALKDSAGWDDPVEAREEEERCESCERDTRGWDGGDWDCGVDFSGFFSSGEVDAAAGAFTGAFTGAFIGDFNGAAGNDPFPCGSPPVRWRLVNPPLPASPE